MPTYADAVPATSSFDSYITVIDANVFLTKRNNVNEWFSKPEVYRQNALIEATQWIDQLDFVGSKTDSNQVLEFPRGGDTEVPEGIKRACILIAKALCEGRSPERLIDMQSMVRQGTVGSKDDFNRWYSMDYQRAGIVSAEAWAYLRPYLRDPREVNLSRIA